MPSTKQSMRLNLKHFIVTSVLVHAAFLGVWTSTQSHSLLIPSSAASAPVFNVALTADTTPVMPTQASTSAHSHTATPHKPRPTQHQVKLKQAARKPTQMTPSSVTPAANLRQAELRRNEVRDKVLSRIRNNLQQYFIYPTLAQRQGWQGRVLLGFSVEADGVIRNIHVAAGSGYPILDTSAVAALSRVPHLYEASDWLQGSRLEMQLPVIFRLQGG